MKKSIMLLLLVVLLAFGACRNAKQQEPENPPHFPTVRELADVVLASVSFPATIEHTKQEDIELFFGFDLFDEASQYIFIQQAMSVHLVELIIIKPSHDGDTKLIMDYLNARRDKLMNDVAFYPNQHEAADASVAGFKEGYYYLICHEDAKIAEAVLLELIK